MRAAAALALAALCACASPPPAPDELALERYDAACRLFAEGKFAEAAPHFAHVIEVRNQVKDAYLKLAACHRAVGREAEAAEVLERLLRVDPRDAEGLRALGSIQVRRGRAAAALELYRRVEPKDKALEGEIARLEALTKGVEK